MSKRGDETLAEFWYNDYGEDERAYCRVVFTSDAAIDLLLSAIRFASFFNTRWLVDGDKSLTDAELAELYTFVRQVERDLIMSCDGIELGEKLERIAVALEGINSKTEELVDWDEALEDIESVLGVGNVFVLLMTSLAGLFPSLKFKVNKTEVLRMAMEYWGFRLPLMAQLKMHNLTLGGILAAMAGEKTIGLLQALASSLNWLQDYYDTVTSPVQAVGSYFWEWLKSFVSPDNGGTADSDDPDADEGLRIIVRNFNNVTHQLSLDVCCILSHLPEQTIPDTVIGDDMPPVDPEGSPPAGWSAYTLDQERCDAAEYILSSIEEFFQRFHDSTLALGGEALAVVASVSIVILGVIAAMTSPVVLPTAFVVVIAAALASLWSGGQFLLTLEALLTSITVNRDALLCILYNATSPEQARADFADALIADGLEGAIVEAVSAIMNNSFINSLFFDNPLIDLSSVTGDCAYCEGCSSVTIETGTWDPETLIVSSEEVGGIAQYVTLKFNWDPGSSSYCGPTVTCDFIETVGTPNSPGPYYGYRIFGQGGSTLYENVSAPPSTPLSGIRYFVLKNDYNVPFSVQLDWTDD